jgi:hypothetical protein
MKSFPWVSDPPKCPVNTIPVDKKIKLNGLGTSGYKEIKEEIKETNCNGKVVIIDGKEYTLQLKG